MNTYVGILKKSPTLEDKLRVADRLKAALTEQHKLQQELASINRAVKTLTQHLSK